MRRAVTAFFALAIVLTACGAPKPPLPPPTPPAPALPARAPTLAIETRYAPELTLRLRLDGVPVTTDVVLAPLGEGGFDGSPGDLVENAPGDEALPLVAKGDGAYAAPAEGLARLTASPGFAIVVAGRRYPYPQAFGTHPAHCAAGLAALQKLEACVDRRPSLDAPPSTCDDAGVLGFKLVLAELAEKFDACWARPDDVAIAKLPFVADAALRHEACRRLVDAAGPDIATPLAARVVPHCSAELPEPVRVRATLARRAADLPLAYERAKTGGTAEMRAFYVDYGMTGDPRVEEIRALAAERFGPKKRTQFVATQKALSAITKEGWHVRLCDVSGDRASISVLLGDGRFGSVDVASASRVCALAKVMMRPRRPPNGLVEKASAVVRARMGVKQVDSSRGCSVDHWYLDPPPKASPAATGGWPASNGRR